MTIARSRITWLAALLAALAVAPRVRAAESRDPAQLLPQSTMVVARVLRLREHWDAFLASPLAKRLENAPIPELTKGIRDIREGLKTIETEVALDLKETFAAIMGDDVTLALFEDETGAFISQAPDAGRLRAAVESFVSVEQQLGRIAGEKEEYYRQVEIRSLTIVNPDKPGTPPKPRTHALLDNLLIVSENPEVVKRIIDVVKNRAPSLAALPEYQEAQRLMRPGALAHVYVDTDRVAEQVDIENLFNGQIKNPLVRIWAARTRSVLPDTRYAVLNLASIDKRLEITQTVVYDHKKLPDTLKALTPSPTAPLDIVSLIPGSAVLAVANRVDKSAFWRHVLESVRQEDPQAAARLAARAQQFAHVISAMDFEREFLPQIKDQLAVFITAGDETRPPALTLIVELANGQAIPTAIRTIAGTAAILSQIEAEKKGIPPKALLERANYRGHNLTTLILKEKKLAGKLNPTLLVLRNFMVLTTSPHAARDVINTYTKPGPRPGKTSEKIAPVTSGRLDLGALTQLMRRHHAFLVKEGTEEGKDETRAARDVDTLIFLLASIGRIDFTATHTPGRIHRTIRIHAAPAPATP